MLWITKCGSRWSADVSLVPKAISIGVRVEGVLRGSCGDKAV